MLLLSLLQSVFIITVSIVTVAIGLVVLFGPLKRFLYHKNYKKIYGKKVYQIALDNDFYLINNFAAMVSNEDSVHIDHILFGEKYIYCIKCRYFNGALQAKEEDKSWIYFTKKDGKKFIDNPLIKNRLRVEKLSLLTNINEDMMISIVVVNNNCLIFKFEGKSKNNYVIPLSKLAKLVKAIESRSVGKINEKQLFFAVNDIAKLNVKNR